MSERGKGLEAFGNYPIDNYADFSYYSSATCKKHPYSPAVGICAYCLKDRLVNLVCSECGEQRASSCSCSDVSSSHRNSCSTSMEVGSVGRVSFLIENDQKLAEAPAAKVPERVVFLRRSSSSCVEVKKTNGFWKIKRLFGKRKNKLCFEENDGNGGVMGVARSRSMCSFRGVDGGNNNLGDAYDDYRFSSAKISDVASGVFLDYDKHCCEPRRSCITAMDESSYIDLKLDLSDRMRKDFSSISDDHGFGFFKGDGVMRLNEENPLKRSSSRRHQSVWKWISKYHPRKG